MRYIIPAPEQSSIRAQGRSDQFPVGRIFCVGQNHADHVSEMGGNPARYHPVFFDKSPDCLAPSNSTFPYPFATKNLHHEVEPAIALGAGSRNIAVENTADLIADYAAALDIISGPALSA